MGGTVSSCPYWLRSGTHRRGWTIRLTACRGQIHRRGDRQDPWHKGAGPVRGTIRRHDQEARPWLFGASLSHFTPCDIKADVLGGKATRRSGAGARRGRALWACIPAGARLTIRTPPLHPLPLRECGCPVRLLVRMSGRMPSIVVHRSSWSLRRTAILRSRRDRLPWWC